MKTLRRLHLYLGCFFAPLLLFYVGTGWYQTVSLRRNKMEGEIGDWRSRLTSIHVDQIFPTESAAGYSPALFRLFVIVMALALIVTVGLGIALALRTTRAKGKWPVWFCLVAGTLVPILLLWFGQRH